MFNFFFGNRKRARGTVIGFILGFLILSGQFFKAVGIFLGVMIVLWLLWFIVANPTRGRARR